MASLESGRESEAKVLGPIQPPDKVCVSRLVSGLSGSGWAGAAIAARYALADRQGALEQNTGLQFGRYSLEILAPAPKQVVSTDI